MNDSSSLKEIPGGSIKPSGVYDRYVNRLIRLAQTRLNRRYQSKLDPDDVVHSVFRTFYRRCKNGQLTIPDMDSLWALLARITVRKCTRKTRELESLKRDARREYRPTGAADDGILHQISSREPTPEDAAMLEDTMRQVMEAVDEDSRQLIELKLQGYTNEEISQRLGRSERTIYRILRLVRTRLEEFERELTPAV